MLTIIGLLIAAYALLPREDKLNLSLRIGALEIFLGVISVIAIHYYQFYGYCVAWDLPRKPLNNVRPQDVSYAIIIFSILLLMGRMKFGQMYIKKTNRLQELVERLKHSKQHSTLISLIDKNFETILKIHRNDFLPQKLKSWLTPEPHVFIHNFARDTEEEGTLSRTTYRFIKFRKFITTHFPWIRLLIPGNENHTSAIRGILTSTLNDKEFVRSIVQNRPYFILKSLPPSTHEIEYFVFLFFYFLIEEKGSILYSEIENNVDIVDFSKKRYYIDPQNQLLYKIFHNSNVAYESKLWKPIADSVIAHLDYANKDDKLIKEYNEYNSKFQNEPFENPVYVGIRFFDLMIREALFQNINSSMQLKYYMELFTEKICDNFSPTATEGQLSCESSTIYSYLLYEIIYALTEWLDLAHEFPKQEGSLLIGGTSIETITECLHHIASTKAIPQVMFNTLAGPAIGTYFQVRAHKGNPSEFFSNHFHRCLLYRKHSGLSIKAEYYIRLINAVIERDNRFENEDYEHATNVINEIVNLSKDFFESDDIVFIAKELNIKIENDAGKTYIRAKDPDGLRYQLNL